MQGKWIWCDNINEVDSYAEFTDNFDIKNSQNVFVKISANSSYVLFINDVLASFTGCSDYPDKKLYNEIDISKHVTIGRNKVLIQVWYEGLDSQRSIKDIPCLFYEITQNEELICFSNKKTKSRLMTEYKNGYKKLITSQLGYSFLFDNNIKNKEYKDSIEITKECKLLKREIDELSLMERQSPTYKWLNDGYLIDLGEETAGFLDLDFTCDEKERILITYGEHLFRGTVRRKIESRDFSVEFVSKPGLNNYINYFRRLAGRYLRIYTKQKLKINYIGIRNVFYPVKVKDFDFDDKLLNDIYKTSIKTLQLCMHEHYEDCPWREQALYTMDSSIQIRCGYYCFENGNSDYVKFNLLLIQNGLRSDGLLDICYPCGIDYPIPSFTLAYIIECIQYVDFTKDFDFLSKVEPTLRKILTSFANRIDDTGLMPEYLNGAWDFYEWILFCASNDSGMKRYSSILNALFLYSLLQFKKYCSFEFDVETFKYNYEKQFKRGNTFDLYDNLHKSSQLSNALAILIGVGTKETAEAIVNNSSVLESTLSMKVFVYDALLRIDNNYSKFILDEIKKNYSWMLEDGATSFYETIKGAKDFNGAGSLCHGWSALPIIYFNELLK